MPDDFIMQVYIYLVVADWIQVKLILKEQLDRETQVQHRMKLIAVDGGPQAKIPDSRRHRERERERDIIALGHVI